MTRKILSLNLAILMLIALFPLPAAIAYSGADDIGYGIFYKNDGSGDEVSREFAFFLSSNANLRIYETMPLFSEDGKVATCFTSESDGSGMVYHLSDRIGDAFTTDSDTPGALYAKWEQAGIPSILYVGTNGLVMPNGDDYYIGTSNIAEDGLFTDSRGRHAVGWATTMGYSDRQEFVPGDEIPAGINTLFAIAGFQYITLHFDPSARVPMVGSEVPGQKTVFYRYEDATIGSSGNTDTDLFIGWNASEMGDGDWYTSMDKAVDAPHHLYAQYEPIPASDFCILRTDHGFADGHETNIFVLDNGTVSLPDVAKGGAKIAYWEYRNDRYQKLQVPAGNTVSVESGTDLQAEVADMKNYYGIIDGMGGLTTSGSQYSATSCYVTSAGNLNVYSFNDLAAFTKENAVLTGYKAIPSGNVYSFDDDIWAAMGKEADADHIAHFEAQYLDQDGVQVQFIGNGQRTTDNQSFYAQALPEDETTELQPNRFVAPAGKYFIGWNTSSSGYGEWYDDGQIVDFTENTILYAQWGINRVIYHTLNTFGGAGEYNKQVRLDADRIGENLSYQPDKVFSGWSTLPDGNGDWYSDGTPLADGTVLTLYENWLDLPSDGNYYVLYAPDLDNGKMAKIVMMDASSAAIKLPNLGEKTWWYNDGKRLLDRKQYGYLDEKRDFYLGSEEITVKSGDIVRGFIPYIYATMHSNYNGQDQQRIYYHIASFSSLQLYDAEDVFTDIPSDAQFDGWNSAPDGSGEKYSRYITTGFYDIYAQWKNSSPSQPTEPPWSPSNNDTGSSSSNTTPTTYRITVSTASGGIANVNPTNAKKGDTVTITASADVGYQLDKLTVTDSKGDELELTNKDNGKYTFVMPGSAVTVSAVFKLVEDQPAIPATPDWVNPFSDVAASAWYYNAVKFVSENGLMNGTSATTFAPNANLSRAQLAQILYNKEDKPGVSGSSPFTDVTAGAWYSDAVIWAATNNIVGGYGGGVFGPDDNITREQLAVMLWRYAGEPVSNSSLSFSDADQISGFAQAAIQWAVENKILNGKGNNILDPKGFATRAEVAQMLKNYLG